MDSWYDHVAERQDQIERDRADRIRNRSEWARLPRLVLAIIAGTCFAACMAPLDIGPSGFTAGTPAPPALIVLAGLFALATSRSPHRADTSHRRLGFTGATMALVGFAVITVTAVLRGMVYFQGNPFWPNQTSLPPASFTIQKFADAMNTYPFLYNEIRQVVFAVRHGVAYDAMLIPMLIGLLVCTIGALLMAATVLLRAYRALPEPSTTEIPRYRNDHRHVPTVGAEAIS